MLVLGQCEVHDFLCGSLSTICTVECRIEGSLVY